jgi:hypothetical protein
MERTGERNISMKQEAALALIDQIQAEERYISAIAEYARRGNWRIRATFRPGSPDSMTLTAVTLGEWNEIKTLWAMLPVDVAKKAS